MGATQGCFWFLRIGRSAIVPAEKLETKPLYFRHETGSQ